MKECCKNCRPRNPEDWIICQYPECFCHQQPPEPVEASWIKKFKQKFPISYNKPYPPFIDNPVATHIIQFIQRLLATHTQELLEKIEGMRDEDGFKFGGENYTKGYNQALEDIKSLIKKTNP